MTIMSLMTPLNLMFSKDVTTALQRMEEWGAATFICQLGKI
jgi:hypothetical protein